jgi:hypothetical protein
VTRTASSLPSAPTATIRPTRPEYPAMLAVSNTRATGSPFLRARHSRVSSSSPRDLLGARVMASAIRSLSCIVAGRTSPIRRSFSASALAATIGAVSL